MRSVSYALVAVNLCHTLLAIPSPPSPEPIRVFELPLPPVAEDTEGACTEKINPHGTGCIKREWSEFQSGDFTPDGHHVIANVDFVGAPTAPASASIYSGEQLILIKADGTNFTNGDPWKCLSCGVPAKNAVELDPQRDYPHVYRSGEKALWGHNVLECGGELLQSDKCTPNKTHIYPLHWNTAKDGSGKGGAPRELRLHPNDEHMGWSSFTDSGGQNCFFGRLEFNKSPTAGEPLAPRYDLVDVNILLDPNNATLVEINGSNLTLNYEAIGVGELRGFTGTGDEIIYIGPSHESSNIDLFAVHVITGKVRRITSHPEYADPIAFSADDEWFVVMDTRGTDRQMWMSAMRQIPPLIDLVAVTVASSTRNNGPRRFFQPILVDGYGDRDNYYGQHVNGAGDESNGSVNDPNWNGRADPAFSHDGTRITYWQDIVVSPQCGGANPLKCPVSTAQGGREYRIMVAELTSRKPKNPPPVFDIPDFLPWAVPFPPGALLPSEDSLQAGNYTLRGQSSGYAHVRLIGEPRISTVAVDYNNYSDDGEHILNGYENVTVTVAPDNPWENDIDWYSDIVQTGKVKATKKTSKDGFHLVIDAVLNNFNATGSLTTVVDGKEYVQPANGT
ncbi:hypothetical protein FSARC_612 [Fusarium sarcochroum]|uniref:Saponin hydrolase n=1 Tax=Fusarium sarcochroum TaxID=1208366 RepID=A0A8H4UB50_9HYPO|nr:hypothetical protein FSARC_612 [Fusarium sarcochroum]